MRRRGGGGGGGGGGDFDDGDGDRRNADRRGSPLTRAVNGVFAFVRLAEFEILFLLFFLIAFLLFKDLVSSTNPPFSIDFNPLFL